MESLFDVDLDVVCQLSQNGHYDFIVIGSGVGGGILTQKLVTAKKRVLLLEKGGLLFSSHCLNTSRPHWQKGGTKGPSQDNDVVYSRVKAKVETAEGSDPYVGGPVYCLGGRSTVWGLFSPKIDHDTFEDYFPDHIKPDLEKWCKEALRLFSWHAKTYPNIPGAQDTQKERDEIEFKKRLLKTAVDKFSKMNTALQAGMSSTSVEVEVATVAAEFIPQWWYTIPQGAYSTVDYLLELLYAKNQFLTVVLNAEVLSLEMDNNQRQIENVIFRDKSQHTRKVKAKSAVVLAAGTIDSARIALRSSLHQKHGSSFVGKGLMDHEIWGVRIKTNKELRKRRGHDCSELPSAQSLATLDDDSSSKHDSLAAASKQPLKLQCMVTVHGQPALLNVCINADTFLGRSAPILRGNTTTSMRNTLNITLQYRAELNDQNEVLNDPGPHPVLQFKREGIFGGPSDSERRKEWLDDMQALATHIRDEFLIEPKRATDEESDDEKNVSLDNDPHSKMQDVESVPAMMMADFGVVAHEVGTMRMRRNKHDQKGVVNEDLKFIGLGNLFICDLSIFPVSPPANPTLTLAAFALRLAERLIHSSC
jgi:choline dehydrogenase-like flavoprotein